MVLVVISIVRCKICIINCTKVINNASLGTSFKTFKGSEQA